MELTWNTYGTYMKHTWNTHGTHMEHTWNTCSIMLHEHIVSMKVTILKNMLLTLLPPGAVIPVSGNVFLFHNVFDQQNMLADGLL